MEEFIVISIGMNGINVEKSWKDEKIEAELECNRNDYYSIYVMDKNEAEQVRDMLNEIL